MAKEQWKALQRNKAEHQAAMNKKMGYAKLLLGILSFLLVSFFFWISTRDLMQKEEVKFNWKWVFITSFALFILLFCYQFFGLEILSVALLLIAIIAIRYYLK